mgnify:CR=1 FL=1
MSQNKKVYAVHGSEDGTIGVYSSKKRAIEAAINYVSQNGKIEVDVDKGEFVSYVETKDAWDRTNATVETFYLK